MTYYEGPQVGDEKPIGGGSFTKQNTGCELYNFKNISGQLYGYVQPYARKKRDQIVNMNLGRIDPTLAEAEIADHVLVIFVARTKDKQRVIGWYKDATVYRNFQGDSKTLKKRDNYCYNFAATTAKSVLLPTSYRKQFVPVGSDAGIGQCNVLYTLKPNGKPRTDAWIKGVVKYINDYDGPNLLVDRGAETDDEIQMTLERQEVRRRGQGCLVDAELRKAIEEHAVKKAISYYRKKGYAVEDVGSVRSYDLRCTKGKKILHVEVKGTQSEGNTIILTRNEVTNAKSNTTALYILSDIVVKKGRGKNYSLTAGKQTVLDPWDNRDTAGGRQHHTYSGQRYRNYPCADRLAQDRAPVQRAVCDRQRSA